MTTEFTLADASSKPYAWMIENVEAGDIEDAGEFVDQTARTAINATNYDDLTDDEVYEKWRAETYEFEQAVKYIEGWIAEDTDDAE